jgi:Protease subunit of ATP-dependent Clp proteases
MGLKGISVKNQTATSVDLYFYGDIVSEEWFVWGDEDQYPDAIRNFLADHEGKDINVYINSGGGSVFAGLAIYNILNRHALKNTVKVYVDGLAGSIASVIAFAGSEKPHIPSNAFLMVHNPWTRADGNAVDLRKIADDLEQIKVGLLNVYEAHLKDGVKIETISELMDAETWLNGTEAANYFDIEVEEAKEYAASTGDYIQKCKNTPKDLNKKQPENKNSDALPQEQPCDTETKEKRNKIKRGVLKGHTKGE